ncbi:MAG: glycosyl transferase [Lachnospiraceae bacterium]|nr:glycosyl transferase [Lachnospiraceae bacterium]
MAIPKIIHYCWLGGNPKPESVINCISSWKKFCPDYEIIEWNESNLNIDCNAYTRQAYDAKAWGFVPDYLRLWIVYTYGGIYLDTDVQMIRNFDLLLEEEGFIGFEDDKHINFGSGFGAEKNNSVIKAVMNEYEDLRFVNEDGSYNKTPSPQYNTQVMKKLGLCHNDGSIQNVKGFKCYPPEYFCPKSFTTGMLKVTRNTFSIHQFDASWYSEEEQAQKLQYWKAARKDYWLHLPNRIARRVLGDQVIDTVKKYLKKS